MRILRQPAYIINEEGLYVLDEEYEGRTAIMGLNVKGEHWTLLPNGQMILHVGFTWNGPDIVLNTPDLMIPSALHDAGCYGLASGVIPKSHAKQVHFTYRDAMKTWRVPWIRRKVQFRTVLHGQGLYAKLGRVFGAD